MREWVNPSGFDLPSPWNARWLSGGSRSAVKAEWGLMMTQHGVMAAVLSLTAHIPTAGEHLVRDYG